MNRRVNAVGTSILLALIVIGVRPVPVAEVARNESAGIAKATQQDLGKTYGMLPLSFESNEGQTDSQVKFLSRGQGTLFLTSRAEAVLVLGKSGLKRTPRHPADRFSRVVDPQPQATPTAVLRIKLVGAKLSPQAEGLDELPGKTNYFIGNDPKKWRTNVPTYAKVKLGGVYPDVDLVYYGNQRRLEQDFIVARGGDPGLITMAVEGADRLSLNAQGDLVLAMKDGEARFRKPVAYQNVDGVRREIRSSYQLENAHQVGFQIAAYDRSRPLIIDPVLAYSTYLGGSSIDYGVGIAVDTTGNAYVTGQTSSSDFPTTMGAVQTSCSSCGPNSPDAFVTKLNPTGSALVYSTYLGGSSIDYGSGIAVDAAGEAYVTGTTYSTNFPTTTGAFQTTFSGYSYTVFVTKLNPTGSALVYSTFLGGHGSGNGIAVDATDSAYVTGFNSALPTTPGAFQTAPGTTLPGGATAFVTRLNPAGSGLLYSTYLGGNSAADQGQGIALDAAGNAYVTGWAYSTNFPTTMGAFQTSCSSCGSNSPDAFVTKLNSTGSALVYSSYLGGSGNDFGNGIAVDASNDAHVTGSTLSTDFPTTMGAFQTSCASCSSGFPDAFVTKLNPAGSGLLYSTYLGGSQFDAGSGIVVDAAGNAYVTGTTFSSDFPTTPSAIQPTFGGGNGDAFLTVLSPLGTPPLVYSSYLGGNSNDFGLGIALDASGNAYLTGYTLSTNFPTTMGAFQTSNHGDYDPFVTKIANIVCTQKEDDDDRDDHERRGERDDHHRHNDRHKAKSQPCRGSDEMESEKRDSEKE